VIRIVITAAMVALAAAPVAGAAPGIPAACSANLEGATTLAADGSTPALCTGGQWQPVALPAPASDRWVSFGAPLALHGQGMRNPAVLAGSWTATPLEPSARCRVAQQNVISPGTLSSPVVSQGPPDSPLSVQVKPDAFTVELGGDCLWVRRP
jgi:hypothetical protein